MGIYTLIREMVEGIDARDEQFQIGQILTPPFLSCINQGQLHKFKNFASAKLCKISM